jgi:predicted phosphodiesterase
MERRDSYTLPQSFPPHDAVVLAGDIDSSPAIAIAWLNQSRYFPSDKPIFYIAGNHEFYGHVIEDELARAKRLQAEQPGRVHFLDADVVPVIEGVRFLGCTLWSDYELNGDRELAMLAAGMGLNDHKLIGRRDPIDGRLWPYKQRDALHRHRVERAWLERQLATKHDGSTVVVTHHGCARGSVHPRHLVDRAAGQLNPAFSSDLTALIEAYQPELWIHGHTHDSCDYLIGSTRVLCNPKGYGPIVPGGTIENRAFNDEFVIDVPEFYPKPTP